MLRSGLFSALFLLLCTIEAFSQQNIELQFGARGGIPFDLSIQSNINGVAGALSSQSFDRPAFLAGPTFTAVLKDRVAIELDALYTPVEGRTGATTAALTTTSSTHGRTWEFPVLADYRVLKPSVGLYFGGGLVAGALTGGTTEIRTTNTQTGETAVRSEAFNTPASQLPAVVVNGGMEWRSGRIVIRPELRYTRWSSVSESVNAVHHPNQFEYLVGISFRGFKH
jgi:hypothetical protein